MELKEALTSVSSCECDLHIYIYIYKYIYLTSTLPNGRSKVHILKYNLLLRSPMNTPSIIKFIPSNRPCLYHTQNVTFFLVIYLLTSEAVSRCLLQYENICVSRLLRIMCSFQLILSQSFPDPTRVNIIIRYLSRILDLEKYNKEIASIIRSAH